MSTATLIPQIEFPKIGYSFKRKSLRHYEVLKAPVRAMGDSPAGLGLYLAAVHVLVARVVSVNFFLYLKRCEMHHTPQRLNDPVRIAWSRSI